VALAEGLSLDYIPDASVELDGDAAALRQMFFNLVDNAIKYNRPGGRVIVRLEAGAGNAAVMVQDTGIGIAADHLPKLFDRFYRADSSRSSSVGGHGLGLSICAAIARAHGGSIAAESTPGKGTVFTVSLPVTGVRTVRLPSESRTQG
jgi:signal transduction histidine kinase